jgi:hypothetical protein
MLFALFLKQLHCIFDSRYIQIGWVWSSWFIERWQAGFWEIAQAGLGIGYWECCTLAVESPGGKQRKAVDKMGTAMAAKEKTIKSCSSRPHVIAIATRERFDLI